ncbi:MAG: hypothetical protein HKN58_06610 [Xanthomonadales bacterium]|nr:hypothetical protein [Xanthomonadales bacterium]
MGGPTGGEPLPWPEPGGGGGDLETLDEQLDDALGDFDESMGAGGGAEDEIDILDPMGGGSSSSASDQPVFEDSGTGGGGEGSAENESVAQRAESGASGGESGQSGQQSGGGSSGSSSGSESGGAEGAQGAGGGGASAGGQQGNTTTGNADEGDADIIPIPDDVGDGRDDDIVLRQIREAAMKEKDPVLRERLWDEYRRIRDQR